MTLSFEQRLYVRQQRSQIVREKTPPPHVPDQDGFCNVCRKSLTGRQTAFCCGACQNRWYEIHGLKNRVRPKVECVHCGTLVRPPERRGRVKPPECWSCFNRLRRVAA